MSDLEALKKAKSQALKYLSYRERSEEELNQFLKNKGHTASIIQSILEDLKNLNYINDKHFAMEWGRSRVERKRFGKERLRQELSAKGVSRQIIESTLNTIYDSFSERDLARACADKKLASLQGLEPEKKMRRLVQYLQRKGFSADIVYETTRPPGSRIN